MSQIDTDSRQTNESLARTSLQLDVTPSQVSATSHGPAMRLKKQN